MPPQSDGTRGFWFCGGGALLPFVLRACCGSMCWPVDRPATHAAAGAAARGVRGGLGDCFTCSGAAARGGFCFGEFFCGWTEGGCGGEGLTTGVVRHACRHRVTARGVFGFVGGALLLFVLRVVAGACVGRWTGQPRMPPRERQHEGLGGDWGILSHAAAPLGSGWHEGVGFCFFEGGALLRIIFQCPPSPENPPLSPVPPAESGWAYCAHWPPKDAPL